MALPQLINRGIVIWRHYLISTIFSSHTSRISAGTSSRHDILYPGPPRSPYPALPGAYALRSVSNNCDRNGHRYLIASTNRQYYCYLVKEHENAQSPPIQSDSKNVVNARKNPRAHKSRQPQDSRAYFEKNNRSENDANPKNQRHKRNIFVLHSVTKSHFHRSFKLPVEHEISRNNINTRAF